LRCVENTSPRSYEKAILKTVGSVFRNPPQNVRFLSVGVVFLQKRLKNTNTLTALASNMPVKCRYLEGRILKTPVKSSFFEGPMAKQKVQALEIIVRQF
jgi:hypothetical protein